MDDAQNLRKVKLFVRIVGFLLAMLGAINFVLTALNSSGASPLSLAFTLLVYFLMLIGGGLLLAFRQDGLEIVFIVLRLYILLAFGTVASGVLAQQTSTIVFGCSILVIVSSLMIFLSHNNVKSLFDKKAKQ